ncbi:hypothetical protein CEE37_03895 [candidate division LCP-89 bacterium B3_LCP]|uniref:Uncharacterized protein n=1 Tax=candidate division LCP-89 bacterium B3_LCP TaxID=2012998 RepID=A0A532V3J2_UNCL8|nr:MAG: hypothetical protein CEE37_03895 [candidate division LCP-89 bacterium B3_LCP]
MAFLQQTDGPEDPDELSFEVILQRIFNETDPAAHRNAIWDFLNLTGDWELFEKISEAGSKQSAANYFQNVLDVIDGNYDDVDNVSDLPMIPEQDRDEVHALYASPLLFMRNSDWAGTAAAFHEILLNEIYEIYEITESELKFEEAMASTLDSWVNEEVLLPLSVIEYMAYSDCLTVQMDAAILENQLALLLTLFFSAQAHLDVDGSQSGPMFNPGDSN